MSDDPRQYALDHPEDPDAYIKMYYKKYGPLLNCCVCGKQGVILFPAGPNDNINIEHGGWCSNECYEKEARSGK
jgi:hypothetical protein